MSLDARITPKSPPCYGCHSDLDKYKGDILQSCQFRDRATEKACEGCARRLDDQNGEVCDG